MPPARAVWPLQPIAPDQISDERLPPSKQILTTFPKRASTTGTVGALKQWHAARVAPKPPRNAGIVMKALPVTRATLTKIRVAAESGLNPKTMQQRAVDLETLFGGLFSALATHEYVQLKSEYKRRIATGRAVATTEQEWRTRVAELQKAFAAGGMPGLDEAMLDRFAAELNADKQNRDYIITVTSSAIDAEAPRAISGTVVPTAEIIPFVGTIVDPERVVVAIRDLCDDPISQGSFTQHFSRSISLSVRIPYPCCSWTGCRWCHKTVTLAGVSISLNVDVGYKVTCCGATAWGQTSAQACATIVGKHVCATCTATVVGVTGVSRTPVASGCEYGLGIEADLTCKVAGHTILDVTYSFGRVVKGPCPPSGLCP